MTCREVLGKVIWSHPPFSRTSAHIRSPPLTPDERAHTRAPPSSWASAYTLPSPPSRTSARQRANVRDPGALASPTLDPGSAFAALTWPG